MATACIGLHKLICPPRLCVWALLLNWNSMHFHFCCSGKNNYSSSVHGRLQSEGLVFDCEGRCSSCNVDFAVNIFLIPKWRTVVQQLQQQSKLSYIQSLMSEISSRSTYRKRRKTSTTPRKPDWSSLYSVLSIITPGKALNETHTEGRTAVTSTSLHENLTYTSCA